MDGCRRLICRLMKMVRKILYFFGNSTVGSIEVIILVAITCIVACALGYFVWF